MLIARCRHAHCTVIARRYGLTETAAAATICHPEDKSNYHVGMPTLCSELKLQARAHGRIRRSDPPPPAACGAVTSAPSY